jgi:hypothetical protein
MVDQLQLDLPFKTRVYGGCGYPNSVLEAFRKHFVLVWMPEKALAYFGQRDPAAVPYLDKLLALPNYRAVAGLLEEEE